MSTRRLRSLRRPHGVTGGAARSGSRPRAVPFGKVKGTLLISRMKYLRARGNEEAERVLRRMSSTDQQVLRGMLLPSSWYASDLVLRFEMTIVALLARGERSELFLDMGRFTADTNLGPNGVQRPYLKADDPHYLLRNVPRMYAAQHSAGARTYEQSGVRRPGSSGRSRATIRTSRTASPRSAG